METGRRAAARATAALAVAAVVLTAACQKPPPSPAPSPPPSLSPSPPRPSTPPVTPSGPRAPAGFVDLAAVDASIRTDIRYATAHNFVGRPITGYPEPLCLLTRQAAEALHRVQTAALAQGRSLKVYDCYRPQRAVDDFVAWAKLPGEQQMKGEFYPDEPKDRLFADGYIGAPTAHSRGSTLDLTLVSVPAPDQPAYVPGQRLVPCTAPAGRRFPDNSVDMGTGFDCFDPRANTADSRVTRAARDNRELLKRLMTAQGFENYPREWWHYRYTAEPYPGTYFDFPVARSSLR
ncbi:D-Ala-D-Ala dipeptidase vanX. Metallo peptidase. MEROPS family M15D [Micromonospora viridifaciens]|uniref:D-alanyl-D-alanine dipeptidase n=1 Tax=Micromonospora viridifaciens TaxID=1881 RepID=A0A1C4YLC0_MICVI|nr:M15 family metallopeptidase [Micromonospora viridifaciens]SCF21545.1 D-Ala-D-Ala dipeptidase vanX. Metallo peptidase. MEROPS family M15D [Micromonospora viridifaciens]